MKKKLKTKIILSLTHISTLFFGFALGIYLLPILIAPDSSDVMDIDQLQSDAAYKTKFIRDLAGSDLLHWGEADVTISDKHIVVKGKIAPGPDYKVYLTQQFVENEKEFLAIKGSAAYIADVNIFENFIVHVPSEININEYNAVVIWCEAFSEFITAAQYLN